MIKRFKFPKHSRIQTLERLKLLQDSEFIKRICFSELTIEELKRLKTDDLQFLYRKEVDRLQKYYLTPLERGSDEKITYFYECEIKRFTKKLKKFRDRCNRNDLPVLELEIECVQFITDKNKRFIFKSKKAQRLYNLKNTLVASSLGYWGYKSVTRLGSVSPSVLGKELLKSSLPIAFFTGVTCKFWSYITEPIPVISKTFSVLSTVALSPIWLFETIINKTTRQFSKRFNQASIPINIVGEISSGTGLTWRQLSHTFSFVRAMVDNLDYFDA